MRHYVLRSRSFNILSFGLELLTIPEGEIWIVLLRIGRPQVNDISSLMSGPDHQGLTSRCGECKVHKKS